MFCSPVSVTRPVGTIVATLMMPIGNYFNKSNQASYIGTSYLLSMCCFTPLYGAHACHRPAYIRASTIFLTCRTTLGYPWSTRGDALGADTVRFVYPLSVKVNDDNVYIESNRNRYYRLWVRPFDASAHCSQSGGRHGRRRVRTRL